MDVSFRFRVAVFVVVLAGAGGAMLAQEGASVWDGVYTQEQAARGQAIYKDNCQACHGEALDGTTMAPALTGDDFMGDWTGKTVGGLVKRTQATMPADDPGALMVPQIVDAVAYVFAKNNFPAGPKELGADLDALNQIRITPKK